MTTALHAALDLLEQGVPVILARVIDACGSAPREVGATMAIAPASIVGTVGGGNLEHRIVMQAHAMLEEERDEDVLTFSLGPALNQCCGGRVEVALHRVRAIEADAIRKTIAEIEQIWPALVLFGAGHVARALARCMEPLPCRLTVVDGRAEQLALMRGIHATLVHRLLNGDAIDLVPAGGYALIMTHSHPLDLDLVEAGLRRNDIAWLGLIGSLTKRARFEHQLRARRVEPEQLRRLVCPIGIAGIDGKEPAVIAAATAAQLLMAFEAQTGRQRLNVLA